MKTRTKTSPSLIYLPTKYNLHNTPGLTKETSSFCKVHCDKVTKFPFNSHVAFWIVSGYEICKNKLESMHKGLKD